jgi:hypothetical protein
MIRCMGADVARLYGGVDNRLLRTERMLSLLANANLA